MNVKEDALQTRIRILEQELVDAKNENAYQWRERQAAQMKYQRDIDDAYEDGYDDGYDDAVTDLEDYR